jgi:hypothetical protein
MSSEDQTLLIASIDKRLEDQTLSPQMRVSLLTYKNQIQSERLDAWRTQLIRRVDNALAKKKTPTSLLLDLREYLSGPSVVPAEKVSGVSFSKRKLGLCLVGVAVGIIAIVLLI